MINSLYITNTSLQGLAIPVNIIFSQLPDRKLAVLFLRKMLYDSQPSH